MARVVFHEPEASSSPLETSAADRFVGRPLIAGGEATYNEQLALALRHAEAIVANPRFRMTYQHRDRKKNILMVQAMLYWRDYKDVLPPDEVKKRAEGYLQALPLIGRLRIGRTIWQRSHLHRLPDAGAGCA
ncbi:MAG: hypothetical protein LC793_14790 [Thermomicrobia bacterium]|nr:hypothetical protein [Thermomicrobia bacterium]MCA1724635.1 hypothetical protein [Thermomicrobia bacterium]